MLFRSFVERIVDRAPDRADPVIQGRDPGLERAWRLALARPGGSVRPGIGEATRVMLRRQPERLILRDPEDPEVAHLRLLAERRATPVEVDAALPCRAVAIVG